MYVIAFAIQPKPKPPLRPQGRRKCSSNVCRRCEVETGPTGEGTHPLAGDGPSCPPADRTGESACRATGFTAVLF